MLSIKNIHASIEDKPILKGIDLSIRAGEIHAIMGPNGSGKSTLASVLAGGEEYEVTEGSVTFLGKDLLEMSPEDRAREGLFLAFQYPVEIPGVSTTNFIKAAVNEKREYRGEEPLDAVNFMKLMKAKMAMLQIDQSLLSRSINEGFSGGEKKRNEIFQMAMLEPRLMILDEMDSGLDIDALRIVANGINKLRNENNAVLIITHYQRLLDYLQPDFVHVLYNGRIVRSGTKELALELEEHGYDFIKDEINLVASE
ncbi:MAG TPA: Fe-S cluster assembly ATPase SufC [Mucilaginibacter sp.]|nr:Fe-S cluster assembly ATPase SufC [Mucilaginibacter sp.]